AATRSAPSRAIAPVTRAARAPRARGSAAASMDPCMSAPWLSVVDGVLRTPRIRKWNGEPFEQRHPIDGVAELSTQLFEDSGGTARSGRTRRHRTLHGVGDDSRSDDVRKVPRSAPPNGARGAFPSLN